MSHDVDSIMLFYSVVANTLMHSHEKTRDVKKNNFCLDFIFMNMLYHNPTTDLKKYV